MLDECEAVSIAVATVAHRAALERTAAAGRHALVEKPMAPTVEDADAMLRAARHAGVTLQVGHVERFNPALRAARPQVRGVKFVEAHRIAQFQPRSLDIDVVFDLMIHDIDTVLDCVGSSPAQVSAVGVAVLSGNEDIANARLEFADGCVANLTASRVSQERLRRIRFFQQDAYLSLDLIDQTGEILRVVPTRGDRGAPRLAGAAAAHRHATHSADPRAVPASEAESQLGPGGLPFRRSRLEVHPGEPLALELAAFTGSLRGRGPGAASGEAGRAALAVAAEVRSAMKRRARQWAVRSSADS
jgi:predicted dehydrogenase